MIPTVTICSENLIQEKKWVSQLSLALREFGGIQASCYCETLEYGQTLLIDASMKHLEQFIQKIDRQGKVIFLIVEERSGLPSLWIEGKVDDVLIVPFRALEVFSKLRHYEQILMWNEVAKLSESITGLFGQLREDFQLTERLQKRSQPKRFPRIKGFQVVSRYFSGTKPGGDYFDLAETQDKSHLSLILTHSTSYGLSSAVLTALMRVAMKLTLDRLGANGAVSDIVRRIYEELAVALNEKDQLSIFYGAIHRRERVLRFLNHGDALVYYAYSGQDFVRLPRQGKVLTQASLSLGSEVKMSLDDKGRLVLLSFGFVEAIGSEDKIHEILNEFREREPVDLLNELAFRTKSNLKGEDDLPAQDCTALVLDVDEQLICLTKQE